MVPRWSNIFPVVLLVLAAGPAVADLAAPDTTAVDSLTALPIELDEEYFEHLDEMNCTDLSGFAYREIPRYVYSDRPDLLYEFVLYWDNRCLTTEPVFRMQLLGSIWDAGFNEGLYEGEVMDHLIDRYDPPTQSKHPELRKKFDAFTADFADQLLPHVPHRSLEEFFCLFYGGQTDEAWALLESEDLEDTWLRFYYDQEIGALTSTSAVPTLAATGGGWWPSGNVAFVGDKPLVGMLSGVRWPHWLLRFVFEVRVGRSDEPYWVNESGIEGRSDRFDAVLVGGEFGRILWQDGRHNLDLFLGVGFDGIKPFKDEDFMLSTVNANVGLGYRLFLGKSRNWMIGADVRREWMGERNETTNSMSGSAWSARAALGFAFNEGRSRRLKGLGR